MTACRRSSTIDGMTTERTFIRSAGVLYLISIVFAGTASVHVLPRLVEPGDAFATAENVRAAEWALHLAVAGDLVTALTEVALSVLFYLLLRPVDRNLALLMAAFRLAFTTMMIANVPNLLTPLRALADDTLPALALISLDAYRDGYALALLFFATHILLLGYLLYRSAYVPKVLGAWLAVASSGLFIYSVGSLVVPGTDLSLLLAAPSGIGEFALTLLLLLGRVRIPASPQPPGS